MTDSTESARVYDLDGTLLRLAVDWPGAEQALRVVMTDATDVTVPDDAGVWRLYELAHEHGLGEVAEDRLSAYERAGAVDAERLPTADALADLSMPVGVCSLNCEAACRIALESHDLLDHVDAVVGRDTVVEQKPHPKPLLAVVDELGGTPEATRFVGDSESDAVCAERAGTRFSYVDGRAPKR